MKHHRRDDYDRARRARTRPPQQPHRLLLGFGAGESVPLAIRFPLPPLYCMTICSHLRDSALDAVRSAGGEWLTAEYDDPDVVVFFSTVDLCGDPRCKTDHSAGAPSALVSILHAIEQGHLTPERVTASAGWGLLPGGYLFLGPADDE